MTYFPLFDGPIQLAHDYWKRLVSLGDTVIDATCGNGHDSSLLAQLALGEEQGCLFCLDVQEKALEATRQRLTASLSTAQKKRVQYVQQSHETFPEVPPQSVSLIVYNLGYLPGSDKQVKTQPETTLKSLAQAAPLIRSGGAISLVAYPGHAEGAIEQTVLLKELSQWSRSGWSICQHSWTNRGMAAPSLFLIQKSHLVG